MPLQNPVSGAPAGAVAYIAANAAPAGWLKANGAQVSRTTYAALFLVIGTSYGAGDGSTTFALPDLRGEFVRSLDDGRGVDSGRGIGAFQDSDNRSHAHTAWTDVQGWHSHSANMGTYTAGGGFCVGTTQYGAAYSTNSAGEHSHNVGVGASGGAETRPRNLAMLACIKF